MDHTIPATTADYPTRQRPRISPRRSLGAAPRFRPAYRNLVQKWLGHAQLSTTVLYAEAVGAEEQDIARRMWE
jgi:hypothetical protein